jgi:hypothetical protein
VKYIYFLLLIFFLSGCTSKAKIVEQDKVWEQDVVNALNNAYSKEQWIRAEILATWIKENPNDFSVLNNDLFGYIKNNADKTRSINLWSYENTIDTYWARTQDITNNNVYLTLRSSKEFGDAMFLSGKEWLCENQCNIKIYNNTGWQSFIRLYPDKVGSDTIGMSNLNTILQITEKSENIYMEVPTIDGFITIEFDVSGFNPKLLY